MEKIVVISTNKNPDYFFYAPYQEHAWNKLGWKLCIMTTDDVDPLDLNLTNPDTIIIRLPHIKELRTQSIAQAGRLYAANYLPKDALIMTCDMDLIPLSDYWHPKPEDITVYGYDLTWRSFYPMGYIAMTGENWKKYMNLTGITEDDMRRDMSDPTLVHSPLAPDWEQWWNWDWSMITQRLKPHEKSITFIDRGQVNIAGGTLAKGRIDRFNWKETQNQTGFIDMHCENNNVKHPVKLEPFLEVWNRFYP